MSTIDLQEILNLPLEERISLAEAIWESVERTMQNAPLTEAQKRELDRCLANYRKSPDAVKPWEEISASLGKLK